MKHCEDWSSQLYDVIGYIVVPSVLMYHTKHTYSTIAKRDQLVVLCETFQTHMGTRSLHKKKTHTDLTFVLFSFLLYASLISDSSTLLSSIGQFHCLNRQNQLEEL